MKRYGVAIAAGVCWALLASGARAQCGVNGDFTGQCVDLKLQPAFQEAAVGDTVEVFLLATSVNAFGQPIQAVDAILQWDETKLELLGQKTCKGGVNTGMPCFGSAQCGVGVACSLDCEAGEIPNCYVCPGTPTEYHWIAAIYADDRALDGINNDCGPGAFCTPYTGRPFNDGEAVFTALKQIFCNGGPAPPPNATADGLVVATFRFKVLEGGGQVGLKALADCQTRQMTCDSTSANPGIDCAVDSDCGPRVCISGVNAGMPCTANAQCLPDGLCPVFCTACDRTNCCIEDDNCPICSFAETRVLGGVSAVARVTNTLGPPVTIGAGCVTPTVSVSGPRYLQVTPAAGPMMVALKVTGVEADVACVAGWVQSDGAIGAAPFFQSPAAWGAVSVRGDGLVSNRTFSVETACEIETNLSLPASATLWERGDVDNNNVVDIFDIVRVIDAFRAAFDSLTPCTFDGQCVSVAPNFACNVVTGFCKRVTRENADLVGGLTCLPDGVIDILDLVTDLDAFRVTLDQCPPPCGP